MSPLSKVDVPIGEHPPWKVERFTVSPDEARFENLRATIGSSARFIRPGEYTRLMRGRTIVMSDTPAEMSDHREPVIMSRGRVLLAGLGLGVVLQAILSKSEVEHVTVIENSQEVIDLVAPHYLKRFGNERLSIVHADIFEWKPPNGERWDVAWFDVWEYICRDNLPAMTKLKRRFASRVSWQGCWCENEARRNK